MCLVILFVLSVLPLFFADDCFMFNMSLLLFMLKEMQMFVVSDELHDSHECVLQPISRQVVK